MSVSCTGAINIDHTSAVIQGTGTNVPPTHQLDFWYGTTPGGPYPTYVATGVVGNNTPAQTVSALISGLLPGTTYYYNMLEAPDIDVSQECSFTTLAANDYQTECLAVDPPTQTGGQLNGHAIDVPNNQTVGFHYGTTSGGPYPNSIADGFFGNGPGTVSWAHNLTGLLCNTTYYYQAEVYDVDGVTVLDTSTECSFTTTACTAVPPVTMNCDTDFITSTSAHFFCDVNNVPVGKIFKCRLGTAPGGPYTTTFVNVTAPNNGIQHIEENLVGLTPNTPYYCVFEVYDTDGVTILASSGECAFTTLFDVPSNPIPIISCGMLFDQSECVQVSAGGVLVWVCIHPGWGLEGQ